MPNISLHTLQTYFNEFHFDTFIRATLTLVLGFLIAKFLSLAIKKGLQHRISVHQAFLLQRVIFYVILFLFIASAIQEFGFEISALLGATGILTVAIGIASQASISNIVSGVFIIGEKPFEIGDTIKVNDIQGEIISIDFLSVKVRTGENTMIRIPNEIVIKSPITNISFYPMRRIDWSFTIPYKEKFEQVQQMLLKLAQENSLCLDDPAPSVSIERFGEAGITVQYSVWAVKANCKKLKDVVSQQIKKAFEEKDIEIPFPTRSLLTGTLSEPLPVKILNN